MNMFERGHSFAWLVSIKSWPERWKPTESLLGTLKNDKLLTCRFIECVRVYDLFKSPSRNYSLFRLEKDEVLVNLRTRTGFNRKTFYFESVGADV